MCGTLALYVQTMLDCIYRERGGDEMNRAQKAELLTDYQAIASGEKKIISYSPRQLREFGQYLPAKYAADFEMTHRRTRTTTSRERWSLERWSRRRIENPATGTARTKR
jgi:hypothetical protein